MQCPWECLPSACSTLESCQLQLSGVDPCFSTLFIHVQILGSNWCWHSQRLSPAEFYMLGPVSSPVQAGLKALPGPVSPCARAAEPS